SPRSSCCCIRLACIFAIANSLEFEAAGPRSFGERFHAPVVPVARAIEGHALDACRLRLFRDALADDFGGLLGGTGLHLGAQILLRARGARQHLVAGRRCDLRIDMHVGAMHREAHRADFPDLEPRLARAAQAGWILLFHVFSPYPVTSSWSL